MERYIVIVMLDLDVPERTYNCSFVDVLNLSRPDARWLTGYSGTTNMRLDIGSGDPNLRFHAKFDDPDEDAGVRKALSLAKILPIATQQEAIELIGTGRYGAVIDACALFRGWENDDVARRIYVATGKEVIYVRKDDTKMAFGAGGPVPYVSGPRSFGEVVYFYSQRHIVGIDFKQPAVVKGLLLLDDSTNRTHAAQAMFRLRKLNRGHAIDVGFCGGGDLPPAGVLSLLMKNEAKEQQEKLAPLLIQHMKFFCRVGRDRGDDAYREKDIEPVSDILDHSDRGRALTRRLYRQCHVRNASKYPAAQNIVDFILDKDVLLKTLAYVFSCGSGAETTVDMETTANVETEAIVSQSFFESTSTIRPNSLAQLWEWWNLFARPRNSMLVLSIREHTVYLSTNLLRVQGYNLGPRPAFIVRMSATEFLVEGTEALPLYLVCGRPMFSAQTGRCLNNFMIAGNHPPLDVAKVLHCVLLPPGDGETKHLRLPLWELFQQEPCREYPPVFFKCPLMHLYENVLYVFRERFMDGSLERTPANSGIQQLVSTWKYEVVHERLSNPPQSTPPYANGGCGVWDLYAPPIEVWHKPFTAKVLGFEVSVSASVTVDYNTIVARTQFMADDMFNLQRFPLGDYDYELEEGGEDL